MTRYYYPDDVITETKDGVRVARIGFKFEVGSDGSIQFSSELPIVMDTVSLRKVYDAYREAWLFWREQYREVQREKFLSKYPSIQRNRASFDAFRAATGEKWPSISAWRRWEEHNRGEDAEGK